ncbi:MAG TPA: nicotinate-nucleotide--dimethylbenzimidazole phosphoribosyltransferase [Syntrophales bacterium]|nr:nicotinate-nucleotide--dimethylbenzimidazole phosphoribosyltransferase [Syntrophales bacterium]HOS76528.1 nicotinate-nucleotide--dimethylbenzimidazole phosphoribosyltransferase [Syntrophales bacterium]HPB69454.1 nicotinate-nucleotide--dimethylbenzimidazole phosphoribosyltransferase [Syntrophales bacterium]HQN26572.1 nicotinate-nucleotide--dimethylbenzimidazole phosphoribosyltransferase [Syntrophales bacterium]HQP28457.1 nicotinate-nucleotide--dimethylbenzimidazole phosphoribosyltransferase [
MNLLETVVNSIPPADAGARACAHARLEQLSMPHWALGRLMDLAEDLAGITGSMPPPVARKTIVTMAADHGVAVRGVSRYPQEVTVQMVRNFVRGGAGINALARLAGAEVVVVDLGVAGDLSDLADAGRILSRRIAAGTRDMTAGPAMSREQARTALEAGIAVARDLGPTTDIFGTGEMGIGNTAPSSAIVALYSGRPVADVTGRGTGIDDAGLRRKIALIERALAVNAPDPADPVGVLAAVGGFEIGGIAGLILGAAAQRKPVLVDGFISTAGAILAARIAPRSLDAMIASHRSLEPGHRIALDCLGRRPLLDLDLRLGEGTGAALALHLVEAAVRVLTDVATFDEANVSKAES